ncbi:cytochrome P450 [Paraphysoderma sedebokerense]|nr:cytochrome P450 [Paraphysoderma sedebokerense]
MESPPPSPTRQFTAFLLKDKEQTNPLVIPTSSLSNFEEVTLRIGKHFAIDPKNGRLTLCDKSGTLINNINQLQQSEIVSVEFTGLRKIPGPKPQPIFGNLLQLLKEDRYEQGLKWFEEFGPVFRLHFFHVSQYDTNDPEICKFVIESPLFTKKVEWPLSEIKDIGGDGLFTSDTDQVEWAKAHKILLPAFSGKAIKGFIPDMSNLCLKLVKVFEKMGDGAQIDVQDWMTRITFQTIGHCGFSYDFQLLDVNAPKHPFIDAMNFCLREALNRMFKGKYWKKLPIPANRKFRDSMNFMNSAVDEVIIERRKHPETKKEDLLDFMLNAKDQNGETLSDLNVREQTLTFLIAGHETTSNLLSWALYYLHQNPEVESRLVKELYNVLGDDISICPTPQKIAELKYLHQVIKETLRMRPPVPFIDKYCKETVVVPGGYSIEAGKVVSISVNGLHQNKSIWGETPDKFNPDHFLPENEAKRSFYTWLPFGAGNRACIGMAFAIQEAKIVLATLLRRYSFRLVGEGPVKVDVQALTMRPNDFKMSVHLRPGMGEINSLLSPIVKTTRIENQLTASSMKLHVSEKMPPVIILYGSNMGASESYAKDMVSLVIAMGFPMISSYPLDEWDILKSKQTEPVRVNGQIPLVIIITSTYNGNPPDNAMKFDKWISQNWENAKPFQDVRFTVFGCGNIQWNRTFQAFPKKVADKLAALGGDVFFEYGEGDANQDLDEAFSEWKFRFFGFAQSMFGSSTKLATKPKLAIISNPEVAVLSHKSESKPHSGAVLKGRKDLVPETDGRHVIHVEIEIPENGVTYRHGDHFEIMPQNDPVLVDALAKRFGLDLDQVVQFNSIDGSLNVNSRSVAAFITCPMTIGYILTNLADLQGPPSKALIHTLIDNCSDQTIKDSLENVSNNSAESNALLTHPVFSKCRTVVDLLEAFPDVNIPLDSLLHSLNRLSPRRYSIANSPLANPRLISLCVNVVHDVHSVTGKSYLGLSSGYLSRLPLSSPLKGAVRGCSSTFKLPDDPSMPIILISSGTGFAPFRSFLQERAFKNLVCKTKGGVATTHVYFGCRNENEYLYKDEIMNWKDTGIISEVRVAFSRQQDATKQYVQDKIQQHREEIWTLVHKEHARVFICGSSSMRKELLEMMRQIAVEIGGLTVDASTEYFDKLAQDGIYNEDIWI